MIFSCDKDKNIMLKGRNVEEKNGMWKGENVGYFALHNWVRRRLSKPDCCEECGKKTNKLDLTNRSGRYLRQLDDWEYRCRACHMTEDERINNLLKGNEFRPLKPCKKCGILTIGIKYCKNCAKDVRREWWYKYNRTPHRLEYLKRTNWGKNV